MELQMQWVRLGNTGLTVSRLAIGGLSFGWWLPGEQVSRVLDAAAEHGVNLIDTAESYSDGKSEALLGEALQGRRERFVLCTKVHRRIASERAGRCSRSNLIASLEQSLRRLRTDYIDLYQLHHPDPETSWDETWSTLEGFVRAGKVRYLGVCNHYGWQLGYLLASLEQRRIALDSVQCAYSIIERSAEQEILPFCRKFNLGMLAYAPLAEGLLTGIYHRDQPAPQGSRGAMRGRLNQLLQQSAVHDLLDALRGISAETGLGLVQLALGWLLAKPTVTAPILGADTIEQFLTGFRAAEQPLADEIVQRIDELSNWRRYGPPFNQPQVDGYALRRRG
jgi:1-deoxyxylulose-5-phosphate synthase